MRICIYTYLTRKKYHITFVILSVDAHDFTFNLAAADVVLVSDASIDAC